MTANAKAKRNDDLIEGKHYISWDKKEPKAKRKINDTKRINWIQKNQWNTKECLLDACYIYGNAGDSLRQAIDAAMRAEGSK